LGPLFYALSRFELAGMRAGRVLLAVWLLLAALGLTGLLPVRPLWVGAGVALFVGQIILARQWRGRDFVRFQPAPIPAVSPTRLTATEKMSVYVTGLCHVEGKYQRFAFLPGFYRTFGTGEHALLCQARDRRLASVLSWPLDEIGMWYAFISPGDIQQLAWGEIRYGAAVTPGIAVTYRLELPAGPQRKRAKHMQETLYIAADSEDEAQRILADLLHQLPPTATVVSAVKVH
jgi:hypothetical protein